MTHEADSAQATISTMAHHVLHLKREHRLPVLVDLTSAPGRTVVFTRTKHGAKALARQLNSSGIPTVDLHGNLSQGARTRNMEAFHSGKATTLVATDVAARGIHVDDVALVVHADPPSEHKAYLHRSGRRPAPGRTGRSSVDDRRAGARGAGPDPGRRHQPDHDQAGPGGPRRAAGAQARSAQHAGRPGRDVTAESGGHRGPRKRRPREAARSGGGNARASGVASRRPQPRRRRRAGGPDAPARPVARTAPRRSAPGSLTVAATLAARTSRACRGGVGEAQLVVERDRAGVVGLDIEKHVVEAVGAQVSQAEVDEGATQPQPCASGSMPTTYTSPSVAECCLVQWNPSIRSSR